MSRTEEERLKSNAQRIEALRMENARLRKKISDRSRKIDTRRKIVAGGVVLKHAEVNEAFGAELLRLLSRFVLPRDRHLFDLPPKGEPKNK